MGPKKSDLDLQRETQRQQTEIARKSWETAESERLERQRLREPVVNQALALTRDRPSLLAATAPVLGQITRGSNQARQQIMEQLPPGAARDVALAELERGKSDTIAGAKNQMYQGAFGTLGSLADSSGAFSLNQLGAALRGHGEAAQTGKSVMDVEAQKKASTMGLLGQAVGAAGTFAGAKFKN